MLDFFLQDPNCIKNIYYIINCFFQYLGNVEVFESRGISVCEQAFKALKNTHRKKVKAVLHVSGDGLRVVDARNKALIVDQTVEKVSFCAPDRNNPRGFSYICRDGTTRRWLCHCFMSIHDTGERLSHAVGCAFSVCYEKKQEREKDSVKVQFSKDQTSFTRMGSFRPATLTERHIDPQNVIPAEPVPVKPGVANPHAVERPHATIDMLQRQGSARFGSINETQPFKRNLSLRLNELPSTLDRKDNVMHANGWRSPGSPIAEETSPVKDHAADMAISDLCKQITQDMTSLTGTETSDFFAQFDPLKSKEAAKPAVTPHSYTHTAYTNTHVVITPTSPGPGLDPFSTNWTAPHSPSYNPNNPFLNHASQKPVKSFTIEM